MTQSGGTFTISDSTTPVTAGTGCTQDTADQVTCSGGENPAVFLQLGPGDDRGETSGPFESTFQVSAGPGDDDISASRSGGTRGAAVNCGRGHDIVRTWPTDRLRANCEEGQAGDVLVLVGLVEKPARRRLRRRGVLRLYLGCEFRVDDGTDECTGKLRLRRKNGEVASTASFDFIDVGYVEFELKRADRRRLRRGHLFTVTDAKQGERGFQVFLEL